MKIVFETETNIDLGVEVKVEGVGFDPDFPAAATLESKGGRPVWVTAWSKYTYTLVRSLGGVQRWLYEGPINGFRSQNLLPAPLGHDGAEIKVLSVSGTYGCFDGGEALDQYSTLRAQWEIAYCDHFPMEVGAPYDGAAAAAFRNGNVRLPGWEITTKRRQRR